MKRMLINATQEEELRMAMVDGQRLYDLNIEAPSSERKKANIYKGKITRIEPSLEAAFVDYGSNRHGFLPLKEISSEYFVRQPAQGGKINIKEVLKEGQDIVVQVDKEERGNKGAALTTFVSLAGRFIVLKPNKARSGGVSRRITGDDRDLARQSLNDVEVPDGMSVILRTAGIDRSAEELAWDLENLLTVWTAILNVVLERPSPFLIYRESDSVVRALRDYLTNDIGEILIDDEATFKEASEHVQQTMPHNLKKLKLYEDPVPLFTRFQIESQIESAFAHTVHLPSGGSIVIDHTEALVSIDINSARATKGGDIEATALNTNLEAADEIARQLRIRDLGGLIVIDFIDMGPQKHQREVENRLRDAVRQDRARVQIGKISRFGLLEMSRQRLRPSIGESSHQTCPRCSGFGTIRSVESLALAILRLVGEEARKERTSKVIAQLPVEVATFLLNEKRDWVQSVEDRNETQIVLVANPLLETPHYEVRRVRDDQVDLPENVGASYVLAQSPQEPEAPQAILARKSIEQPVVGVLKPSKPVPQREEAPPEPAKSLWTKIKSLFAGDGDADKPGRKKAPARKSEAPTRQRTRRPASKRAADGDRAGEERAPQRKKQKKQSTRKKAPKDAAKRDKVTKDVTDAKPDKPQPQDNPDAGAEPKRSPRSRRSRGGRRRRRGGADKVEQTGDAQQQDASQADTQQPQQKKQQDASQATGQQQNAAPRREPKPDVKTDSTSAQDSRPQQQEQSAEPKREQKAEPVPAPQPDVKADSTAAQDSRSQQQEQKAAPKPEPKAEPVPAPKPDVKPESTAAQDSRSQQQEQKAAPKREPKAEPKPEPKTDAAPAQKQAPSDNKPAAEPRLLPWATQQIAAGTQKTAEKPRAVAEPQPAPESAPPRKEVRSEPKQAAAPEQSAKPRDEAPASSQAPKQAEKPEPVRAARPEQSAKPRDEAPATSSRPEQEAKPTPASRPQSGDEPRKEMPVASQAPPQVANPEPKPVAAATPQATGADDRPATRPADPVQDQ
ncbi:MAG TPA: Rne/Rng family ribonuclease [Woeseiaceae bacterium]